MLKEILAITGKPGLFRVKAHTGKSLIVEDIQSGKRFPVSLRDKVVSLGDIAMYTYDDDKPLGEILEVIYKTEEGNKIDVRSLASANSLKEKFELYIPNFDKERVRDSDIKKLFTWYNLLTEAGINKFIEEEKVEDTTKETAKSEEANKEK